jgi:FkbM family methyltransferase
MNQPVIIYDFGANNGDDTEYYLLKADKVIAVEANPVVAELMRQRFPDAIADGRLVVEACALTAEESAEGVPFYVHRKQHTLSQFPKPPADQLAAFEEIRVPARNVVDLVREHGAPHYIKIDIEHYDHVVLRALFEAGIRPPYISAESHTIEVFALMVALGRYDAFKMIDGASTPVKYTDHPIATRDGPGVFSFKLRTAGPFGQDLPGPWMTKDNLFRVLAHAGLGWKDIHASLLDAPDPRHLPKPRHEIRIDY